MTRNIWSNKKYKIGQVIEFLNLHYVVVDQVYREYAGYTYSNSHYYTTLKEIK